ncbi:nitroreductase/quinone reductase family protein [Actinoplanes oblitus]|uniref:Nitroreductase/quinone reductase family protein n=1 Tax=Actinoplanes oblitus TaxID=3040509 RepID=A0ABY8W4W5_9ACTN|nr:nitroreductase/quinone reductase family protein [Actinoplanes oblitus]WIM92876.1 nitroreductase/quinone reductase family protein [Actinoplanes oblitus]
MPTSKDTHHHEAVRQFTKRVLNPVMRTMAGRRHWYAAALHHTGRNSGRAYTTPVVAEPVPGGFLIPMPYGSGVDWQRNLRAAGRATIDLHGRRSTLTGFQVIGPDQALPRVRPARRWVWRRLNVKDFLYADAVSDQHS